MNTSRGDWKNRYRVWIDRKSRNVFLSTLLLSWTTIAVLIGTGASIFLGPSWITAGGIVALPVLAFLAVAQMTHWRWDVRR